MCSPSVVTKVAAGATGGGGSIVSYQASAFPVTLTLNGAVKSSSNHYHILIGQQCSPTLNLNSLPVDPNGVTGCKVTNLQWAATRKTIQHDSWVVSADQSSATFPVAPAPYSFTQTSLQSTPAPTWYWDDIACLPSVTCTATVTPPSGQGAAFTATATQNIYLDAPTPTNSELPGNVQINANYPAIDPDNPGVYCLWAGPGANNTPPFGIYFVDTVTTPTVSMYGGAGTWYHLQKLTPSMYRTPPSGSPVGSIYNGQTGLDGSFPYGQTFPADGSTPIPPAASDNDSPGMALQDPILLPTPSGYKEYNIVNEKFTMYIMYTPPPPPVGDSIPVPLTDYAWSWNVDVKVPTSPTTSWANWGNTATNGTITVPDTDKAVRVTDFPTWSQIVRASWK